MKWISLLMCGAIVAASTLAMADETADATRQERIDAALADYRAGQPSGTGGTQANDCTQMSDGGTFARAEASIKRGACKTGHAIEHGIKKTGQAIDKAAQRTGDALRRTGEKLGGSSDKAKSDPTAP